MAADLMPKQELIDQLKKALLEYEIDDKKENWTQILMFSTMCLMKDASDSHDGGVIGLADSLDEMGSIVNRMHSDQ